MQLDLNGISFTYPEAATPTLQGATLTFSQGWTGIVGDNGCGKTTLALVAAKMLRPDQGSVAPNLYTVYCEQDCSIQPPDLFDFAADWSKEAVAARTNLGIEEDWLWRYEELSGGQRKRIQIACALAKSPDALILDEPTNELDSTTRAIVLDSLRVFKGIGIVISHDRELLEKLADQCLVFDDGRPIMIPGGFAKAMEVITVKHASAVRERKNAKNELARLNAEAARRNTEAARSDSRLSLRKVGKHDSSTREKIGRARVTGKDGISARASSTMQTRIEKVSKRVDAARVSKRYQADLGGYGSCARASSVAHISQGVIAVGDFKLSVPELWVGSSDHVALIGDNGAGKSVFTRRLVDCVSHTVKMAYIPQDVSSERRLEIIASLREADTATQGQILSIVAALNSNPENVLDGGDISPGELRKLMLAQQLILQPEFLILDEPTNHLDIGSIEALGELLRHFPGAVFLVSHDKRLVEATCPIKWHAKLVAKNEAILTVA